MITSQISCIIKYQSILKVQLYNHGSLLSVSRYLFTTYPKHNVLAMPALSPTMTSGKIMNWVKKEGDQVGPGDVICDIETDKATMGFEVQEKGFIAKISSSSDALPIGTPVAIITKKAQSVKEFANYQFQTLKDSKNIQEKQQIKQQINKQQKNKQKKIQISSQENINKNTLKTTAEQKSQIPRTIIASPLAKKVAKEQGLNLNSIHGSGTQGRIIKQDVQNYKEMKQIKQSKITTVGTQNPFEEIAVSSMRQTIAARLTESKTTIPHYYVQSRVEMGALMSLRAELNLNSEGVKISVNDIIVKAVALALRDMPAVNSQWHGKVIRRFKRCDVSVAVAIDGGLITPIIFSAQTLGLIEIAKRTKDLAKRAREGKLSPSEFVGGTSTVSNLGMFGIDSVTSVINPPQSTILGVGQTRKQIIYEGQRSPTSQPYRHRMTQQYRVAEIMQLIVSADHRVVDGALAAQWLSTIKKYLQNPINMLL